MGQVIAIISQKGGVGKTSTAVNLGACLSAAKKKVLLIEIDPQCGLSKCFGLDTSELQKGILNIIEDGASAEAATSQGHPRLPRLDIIPANIRSLAEERKYLELLRLDTSCLRRVLAHLKDSYDYIFMDCPPRLDQPTYAALIAADSYLIPIQCEYAAMGTVGSALKAALEVKRLHNVRLGIFGFVLTMADKRAGFTLKVVQEVRQYLKDHVFRTIIPRDPRLAEVPMRREPVIAYDMQSPGAKAYIQLAREVLVKDESGRPQQAPPKL